MHPRFEVEPRGNDMGHFVLTGIAIVFWAVVIFGLVMLISWYARRQSLIQTQNQQPVQDPIDIAKARYARGDITKEEFTELKKDLA